MIPDTRGCLTTRWSEEAKRIHACSLAEKERKIRIQAVQQDQYIARYVQSLHENRCPSSKDHSVLATNRAHRDSFYDCCPSLDEEHCVGDSWFAAGLHGEIECAYHYTVRHSASSGRKSTDHPALSISHYQLSVDRRHLLDLNEKALPPASCS